MAGSSWTNQVQNQLVIAGPGGGVFVYDPTPGANHLIGSVTDATKDSFGNATLPVITAYSKAAVNAYIATQMGNPSQGGIIAQLATSEAGPYGQLSALVMDQGGNVTLDANGNIKLSCGENGTGSLEAQTPGVLGFLPVMQADISTHAVPNTGTAGDITKSWAVLAGDGTAGTTYTIKAHATVVIGATTAETLTLGADIDGTQTPLATLGAVFNGSTLSAAYDIPLELVVIVDAVSAGVPEVYLSGPLGNTSANRLSVNSANMSGHSNTTSWSGAASHTLAVYAQWGGAGGTGQNIQTIASRLYREGP